MKFKNLLKVVMMSVVLFFSTSLFSQGYFVAQAGNYVPKDNFKTNVQSDLSMYAGSYSAASETYESNYRFVIVNESDGLKITMISGATADGGDNWMMDTLVFRNVSVSDGKFTLKDIPSNFGNSNFRFVNARYKEEGKNVKTEGLVMEEYMMFAKKE